MAWTDALNQRKSARSMQPTSGGTQRAGRPGMGGGSIPYAKGATSYMPSNEPPRHVSQPQSQQPPGLSPASGGPPPGGPPAAQQSAPQGGPQASAQANPMAALAYANYLMRRFSQAREQGQKYRV